MRAASKILQRHSGIQKSFKRRYYLSRDVKAQGNLVLFHYGLLSRSRKLMGKIHQLTLDAQDVSDKGNLSQDGLLKVLNVVY
uniref:Uncharacterized protein n=1 Tax=Solanum tuberosum TaxID=4113 RepID=M1DF83_SOLTU